MKFNINNKREKCNKILKIKRKKIDNQQQHIKIEKQLLSSDDDDDDVDGGDDNVIPFENNQFSLHSDETLHNFESFLDKQREKYNDLLSKTDSNINKDQAVQNKQ